VSKKKLFTLIHGETVHIPPGVKALPESSYSSLIEANELIQKVKEGADQYRLEVLHSCEEIKSKAAQEGYQEGFKEWAEHIALLEAEIKRLRDEMKNAIVPVALKAAKKIVGREIELSDEAIIDIVTDSLKAVSTHKRITLYVNRKDQEILEKQKAKLKQIFESLETFSIRERSDILPGDVVIETEGGIINAKLENKWRVLEQAFQKK